MSEDESNHAQVDGDFFELSLDNVCVAGLDGYLKRVNPSWTRTLGWTSEELTSRPSIEFVHPEDRAAVLAARENLERGIPLEFLVNRYVCKDGSYRWLEWRSVAHPSRQLVYAVARDITAQKETERRLREAQELQEKLQRQLVFADRMASVGTLAAGVAHEINNPLSYVMANIALIVEELPAQQQRLAALAAEAYEGTQRIQRIVGGLKTFSRTEDERRTVLEVQPLLERSINMTLHEVRHRARLVRDFGETPRVWADDARLGQVFLNLLINAAQALPDGDGGANEIRISTSTDAVGRAIIEFQDTGTGIPPQLMERIFEPFFTTKPIGVGTGLGLAICHNLVTAMQGELLVESEEGVGTTFRIVLPPAARFATPPQASTTARTVSADRGTVLVVDDEPAIGAVIRRLLARHEVTAVTTVREALELLDSGEVFDVILSDLMMPDRSGMAFFDDLTRRHPEHVSRVIFISGGAFTPAARTFLDRIANRCLEKPFDPLVMRELVDEAVRKRRG